MFELPRYVIQGGRILVEDGELRTSPFGKTLHVAPEYDPAIEVHVRDGFEQYYSVCFRNYPIAPDEVPDAETVSVQRAS